MDKVFFVDINFDGCHETCCFKNYYDVVSYIASLDVDDDFRSISIKQYDVL